MTALIVLGIGALGVAATVGLYFALRRWDGSREPLPPLPELHHEPPPQPAQFPGPEPLLDYQPCEPFTWWLNDATVDRAGAVR